MAVQTVLAAHEPTVWSCYQSIPAIVHAWVHIILRVYPSLILRASLVQRSWSTAVLDHPDKWECGTDQQG